MNTQEKIAILKSYALFKNLSIQEIEGIAQSATERIFPEKSNIIAQGLPAKAVYCIYKGLVSIHMVNEDGKVIPIRVKGPVYIAGELNLFDNEATTYVAALQETHTLVIRKEILIAVILKNPLFALDLLKMVTEKLRAANMEANYYFSTQLKERTWKILKTLTAHFPNDELPLSQEELSHIVGASRARVTEILDQLESEKLISLSRRKIRIL